jgi:hypothetical protein
VLTGMEHTFHALLVVALLLLLARAVRRPLTGRELAGTAALALLAGAVRYETLFLAGGTAVALLLASREGDSGLLARLRRREVWAFLLPPLLVTGLLAAINLHNGQYPLPNSVLAKSGLGAGQGLAGWVPSLGTALATLTSDLMVCAVLLLAAGYLAVRRLGGAQSGLCVAWVVMALLHVLYAKFGWFDRYQGYLVVSGMLLALRVLPELRLQAVWPRALLAVAVLAAVPAFKFSLEAQIPQYAHTVHQQQYTTARLLAAAYDGSTVLVNDIGEVGWLHRGGLVDMWALGSYDVLRAYRTGRMGKPFIAQLAARDGIQVVAVYGVLHEYVPDDFVQIARWSFTGNGRPDDSDVVFYGPTAQSAATLRRALRDFAPSLPAGVQVLWSTS